MSLPRSIQHPNARSVTNFLKLLQDMGVWSLAMVLPNIFMPFTGSLLDRMQSWSPAYNLGYFFLFLTAVIEIAIGTYLVRLIRKIR